MTSARLSPAANLLRNSKVFALPAAVQLPPAKPTSEPFARSDTSTTPYPTRAAIYTSSAALASGDWGLKRALPQKAFTRTKTPVIRLQGEIDTREHVADFESAGDHVFTLQKWETSPVMIGSRSMQSTGVYHSVFAPEVDNTTVDSSAIRPKLNASATKRSNPPKLTWDDAQRDPKTGQVVARRGQSLAKSVPDLLKEYTEAWEVAEKEAGRDILPRQPLPPVRSRPKRWRFRGPWLAGLSNLSFEQFMSKVDNKTINLFRDHLKERILEEREKEYRALADTAEANQSPPPAKWNRIVTGQDIDARLQHLRHKPNDFGPEIAKFFDLPRGPTEAAADRNNTEYMYPPENTEASENYQNYGLPRTHPSAGFSYLRSTRYAYMDPLRGPVRPNRPLPARILKDINNNSHLQEKQAVGVGGMVTRVEHTTARSLDWQPYKGGRRVAASFKDAMVLTDGSLEIGVNIMGDATARLDEKDVPVMTDEAPRPEPRSIESLRQFPSQNPSTWNRQARRAYEHELRDYKRVATPSSEADNEVNSMLESIRRGQ